MKRAATALVVSLALVAGAAPASAAKKCSGTARAYKSGPNIIASDIEITRVGCRPAKQFLRSYFRHVLASAQTNGGCAQRRTQGGCRYKGWNCTVKYRRAANQLRGRCAIRGKGGKRVIRFEERDIGSR